ncbi:MAG TPA: hypothetical protein VNV66_08655 [Pilimelia sp.]|nr:hypothetical protein [Pilimelia sp.]
MAVVDAGQPLPADAYRASSCPAGRPTDFALVGYADGGAVLFRRGALFLGCCDDRRRWPLAAPADLSR